MSLRPRQKDEAPVGFKLHSSGGNAPPAPTAEQAGLTFNLAGHLGNMSVSDVGRAAPYQSQGNGQLLTGNPTPYNDHSPLTPKEFEDHDGGPWNDGPIMTPRFESVPQKWVIAPELGSAAPALAVFPQRRSNSISFAPDVHLTFSRVWTPIIARFTQLYLTDVDKKSHMPDKAQMQHWLVTFNGKSSAGTNSIVLRIRVNNTGDQLEGVGALPRQDTDYVQSFIDFPPPPAAQVGFDSSTAVVVNGAFSAYDPNDVEVVFSKLDESVERERRIERARQAWTLFVNDIKQRSERLRWPTSTSSARPSYYSALPWPRAQR